MLSDHWLGGSVELGDSYRVSVASKLQLGAPGDVQFGTSKLNRIRHIPKVSENQFGVWRALPSWKRRRTSASTTT